jgi:hypothetical protein
MKVRKLQDGGYPTNVTELLDALSYDLRPSTLPSPNQDEDIRTNQLRRTTPPEPARPDLRNYTPPPQGSIGGDQKFYSVEEQRQREFMRPGGTSDQMKSQMGEFAAGMVPGLGDAMEVGYIGRDFAAGDYDAAGLGALLMLLPGAMGKYAVDAYKKFRPYFPDRKRTEAIDDLMENYMTRENKFQREMRQDEERILRQSFGEDIEEARRGFQQVDNLRIANPVNEILGVNNEPAVLREYGRLLDPDVPYTEKRNILDRLGSTETSVEDAIRNLRDHFDAVEMLTGPYAKDAFLNIPEDALGLAAGRRGGMPLEEFYRRVAGNPVPGEPLSADAIRELQSMFDQRYSNSVMERVADYFEQTGKKPDMLEVLELIEDIRRQDMGITSQDLLKPQFRNEKGGKIPYKIKKRS